MAFSLNRVPQVGQIFVFCLFSSRLISVFVEGTGILRCSKLYHTLILVRFGLVNLDLSLSILLWVPTIKKGLKVKGFVRFARLCYPQDMSDPISLYLHIPFCTHRCSYCDFNTYANQERWIPDYIAALETEIAFVTKSSTDILPPVHTVFLGGGTPSLIPADLLHHLLQTIQSTFTFTDDAEITLEANPGTLSADALNRLRLSGYNRLSMGMQSANPQELMLLERQHSTSDVIEVVAWARKAGFTNINLDLIFGIPGQSLASWRSSLEMVFRLKPEHLSLYALTIEHNTPFQHWLDKGLVQMPDDDLAADMYDLACELLAVNGYRHYEISNWALQSSNRDLECRHNLQYWRNQPYLGFGAGAHGYIAGMRTANVRGIRAYIKRCSDAETINFPVGPACEQHQDIDQWTAMQEHMMVGLRLLEEGVNRKGFEIRFGVPLEAVFEPQISQLIHKGLVEWGGEKKDRLRLTRSGWLLGNMVFCEFVDNPDPLISNG